MCVTRSVCVHAREGRGAPSSRLAAALNLILNKGQERCQMRGEGGTQGWRRSEVSPLQKLVGPWEQKGNLGGRRGSPSTDLSPTGPGGGGGGGAGVGGPEPHVPRPRSGLWPRRGGAGRGRCGPSRPTALTVNSNPRAALVMVYRSSHW